MPITISEREFATTPPADLDEMLITSTGCTAAEHLAMLAAHPTPVGIAAALAPFLAEADGYRATVAALLAGLPSEELIAARAQVVTLLNQASPAAQAPIAPVADPVPAATPVAVVPGQPA